MPLLSMVFDSAKMEYRKTIIVGILWVCKTLRFSSAPDILISEKTLSLRTSESPLVPASMPVGVKNAPSPEAGGWGSVPTKG